MSLINRLLEPIRDYISLSDLLFNLSSFNNEPLNDVVYYLICRDLELLDVYSIDMNHKIEPIDFAQECVHYFLEGVHSVTICKASDWVLSSADSLDDLSVDMERSLTEILDKHTDYYFKMSDLLSFEPLDGLLNFITTNDNQSKTKTLTPIILELGEYQKLLISYELFTPHHITCLITDKNPTCNHNDNAYNTIWDMVTTSLDAETLIPVNEKYQIPVEQVKTWLIGKGFIYKDFNSNLPNHTKNTGQPNETLTDAQAQVAQLTIDNANAQNELADLKEQLRKVNVALENLKKSNPNNDKYFYTTPAIDIMNAVIKEFWINYDPDQPAPKQLTITTWITDNFKGISPALALNIDKVCRHSDARGGGRYKR